MYFKTEELQQSGGAGEAHSPTCSESFTAGGCSVEVVSYAVGEVVGFESVKSASRMNSAVVIFLDEVVKWSGLMGFNYNVFVTSETMKCFGCGAEGHLTRACPEARRENG
ncbi:hypothetical protein L3Q82_020359 [Scortum barcoo]|uniref:Uncharacterized protein n=1 Tax=Scortum barcoo TaxID=214431 RepID=A0ACB8V7G1_9TELE|nr:hypothetical protein L3Q82_020359 [Scortum barcoo]